MLKSTTLFFISFLFLSACTYTTEDIRMHEREHETYNYQGKTYQFLEKIKVHDPDNKLKIPEFDINNFVKSTISNKLKEIGLKQSTAQADIIISYGIDIDMNASKFNLFGNSKDGFMINKPKSALTIVISNKKNNVILWSAWVNAQYKQLETEVAKKRIEYAISELFKKFPN